MRCVGSTSVSTSEIRWPRALFVEATAAPAGYLRLEWWDPREGPLPNPDVSYPELERPAAFLCAGGACSAPVYDSARLGKLLRKSSEPGT
jgi:hypothetical protein